MTDKGRKTVIDRQKQTKTDGKIDRQGKTDNTRGGGTYILTDEWTNIHTDRRTDGQTSSQTSHKQTGKQTIRHTMSDRQKQTKTDRQTRQ